jgi:hypothetical protein
MNPLVTFDEAEMEHLRAGTRASAREILDWLEEASRFSRKARAACFAMGEPVIDGEGNVFWSEEEYLGVPEWARREKRE